MLIALEFFSGLFLGAAFQLIPVKSSSLSVCTPWERWMESSRCSPASSHPRGQAPASLLLAPKKLARRLLVANAES